MDDDLGVELRPLEIRARDKIGEQERLFRQLLRRRIIGLLLQQFILED